VGTSAVEVEVDGRQHTFNSKVPNMLAPVASAVNTLPLRPPSTTAAMEAAVSAERPLYGVGALLLLLLLLSADVTDGRVGGITGVQVKPKSVSSTRSSDIPTRFNMKKPS
jgi:hypothetical protein